MDSSLSYFYIHSSLQKDFYLGEIPLLSPRGSLIFNGVEWALVNQLIRVPGIYTKSNVNPNDSIASRTTIISQNHPLMKIEISKIDDIRLSIREKTETRRNRNYKLNILDYFILIHTGNHLIMSLFSNSTKYRYIPYFPSSIVKGNHWEICPHTYDWRFISTSTYIENHFDLKLKSIWNNQMPMIDSNSQHKYQDNTKMIFNQKYFKIHPKRPHYIDLTQETLKSTQIQVSRLNTKIKGILYHDYHLISHYLVDIKDFTGSSILLDDFFYEYYFLVGKKIRQNDLLFIKMIGLRYHHIFLELDPLNRHLYHYDSLYGIEYLLTFYLDFIHYLLLKNTYQDYRQIINQTFVRQIKMSHWSTKVLKYHHHLDDHLHCKNLIKRRLSIQYMQKKGDDFKKYIHFIESEPVLHSTIPSFVIHLKNKSGSDSSRLGFQLSLEKIIKFLICKHSLGVGHNRYPYTGLTSRRLKRLGELFKEELENQIRSSRTYQIMRYKQNTLKKIKRNLGTNLFDLQILYQKSLKGLRSTQLCQYLEQTNPLTSLTHVRRVSLLGPGGLTIRTVDITTRDINSTYYGRICPIETPEGESVGVVNSLSIYARVDQEGQIETPYRHVKEGLILNQVDYLRIGNEKNKKISQFHEKTSKSGRLLNPYIYVRFDGFERSAFYSPKEIDYIEISSRQLVSPSTSLIPFLEHNDGNRALMGSNMQRQAVPLIHLEEAIVGTGTEPIIIRDSGYHPILNQMIDGRIFFIDGKSLATYHPLSSHKIKKIMRVKSINGKSFIQNTQNEISCLNTHQRSKNQLVKAYTKKKKFSHQPSSLYPEHLYTHLFNLPKISITNQKTSYNQKTFDSFYLGSLIQTKDYISSGYASRNGELSLGQNIFVGFMSYNGYSFEDSIILSERLLRDYYYQSLHLESYTSTFIIQEKKTSFLKKNSLRISRTAPTKYINYSIDTTIPNQMNSKLDINGVIQIGQIVYKNDLLIAHYHIAGRKKTRLRNANLFSSPHTQFMNQISYVESRSQRGYVYNKIAHLFTNFSSAFLSVQPSKYKYGTQLSREDNQNQKNLHFKDKKGYFIPKYNLLSALNRAPLIYVKPRKILTIHTNNAHSPIIHYNSSQLHFSNSSCVNNLYTLLIHLNPSSYSFFTHISSKSFIAIQKEREGLEKKELYWSNSSFVPKNDRVVKLNILNKKKDTHSRYNQSLLTKNYFPYFLKRYFQSRYSLQETLNYFYSYYIKSLLAIKRLKQNKKPLQSMIIQITGIEKTHSFNSPYKIDRDKDRKNLYSFSTPNLFYLIKESISISILTLKNHPSLKLKTKKLTRKIKDVKNNSHLTKNITKKNQHQYKLPSSTSSDLQITDLSTYYLTCKEGIVIDTNIILENSNPSIHKEKQTQISIKSQSIQNSPSINHKKDLDAFSNTFGSTQLYPTMYTYLKYFEKKAYQQVIHKYYLFRYIDILSYVLFMNLSIPATHQTSNTFKFQKNFRYYFPYHLLQVFTPMNRRMSYQYLTTLLITSQYVQTRKSNHREKVTDTKRLDFNITSNYLHIYYYLFLFFIYDIRTGADLYVERFNDKLYNESQEMIFNLCKVNKKRGLNTYWKKNQPKEEMEVKTKSIKNPLIPEKKTLQNESVVLRNKVTTRHPTKRYFLPQHKYIFKEGFLFSWILIHYFNLYRGYIRNTQHRYRYFQEKEIVTEISSKKFQNTYENLSIRNAKDLLSDISYSLVLFTFNSGQSLSICKELRKIIFKSSFTFKNTFTPSNPYSHRNKDLPPTKRELTYSQKSQTVQRKTKNSSKKTIFDTQRITSTSLMSNRLYLSKVLIGHKYRIQVGDKLTGRYGNKGVVSKIIPLEDMPYLRDGTSLDVLLNPFGVSSRMNLGQLYETHLAWLGVQMGKKMKLAHISSLSLFDLHIQEIKKYVFHTHQKYLITHIPFLGFVDPKRIPFKMDLSLPLPSIDSTHQESHQAQEKPLLSKVLKNNLYSNFIPHFNQIGDPSLNQKQKKDPNNHHMTIHPEKWSTTSIGQRNQLSIVENLNQRQDILTFFPNTKLFFHNSDLSRHSYSVEQRNRIHSLSYNHRIFEDLSHSLLFESPTFNSIKEDTLQDIILRNHLNPLLKHRITDSFAGIEIDNPITVGYMYMMKLNHMVENKIHSRSTGPYNLITQQPLKGKSKMGGQRIGEMELWSFEAYGTAYTILEMLSLKSDDLRSRKQHQSQPNRHLLSYYLPEMFKVLQKELLLMSYYTKISILSCS
uniref:DNA-directed RNA polymerase n=1 Tax=Moramonas marocensis TaxID=1805496 RepID=A0A140F2J3_9EUKA|nr:RNA polymerase subunit beta [Moramonas marocensis]